MDRLSHDVKASADRVHVSRATMWRLIQDGEINSFKIRGKRYITEAELLRYLAQQEQAERERVTA